MTSQQPIDHGWAWMCTLGASVSMFFFIGMLRSLGILLVDVIVRFNSSSAMASLMMGLMGAGVSLSAPIGTAVGARYDSYRSVVIWGASVACIATVATAFATNIHFVVFVYGIFSGVGFGVISGPAIVTVGMYFNKRRSLANGLATAGGSVGQLVLPILIRFLLDEFSFQGGMMIFSAFMLHMIPAALLLRPLSFYNRKKSKPSNRKELMPRKSVDVENGHANRNSWIDNGKPNNNGINGVTTKDDNDYVKSQGNGVNGKADPELNGHHESNEGSNGNAKKAGYTSLNAKRDEHERTPTPDRDATPSHYFKQRRRTISTTSGDGHAYNRRKISVYSSQMSLAIQPPAGQLPETPAHAPWSQVFAKTICCCCVKTDDEVVPLVTWKLFKNKVFCLYLFGVCMGNSGYLNALLFLPPYADELQVSKTTAAIFMSAMGIADLLSRILGGWFGDLGIIARHKQLSYSLMLTGMSTMVCCFFASFTSLVVMLSILGLLGGFYLSLMAVVLVDLMGLKHLSAGFGLTIMMQGVTNIVLPTGLGYIRDVTGSYQVPFLICGMMMFVGGISFLLQPFLIKHEARKNRTIDDSIELEKEKLEGIETNI